MECIPIKTRVFEPPKDDIFALLDESIFDLKEKDVLLISSKIMAIHQGRCFPIEEGISKHDLVAQETNQYLEYTNNRNHDFVLSIVENAIISSAGIDKSNGNGFFIYLPKNPSILCEDVCKYLKNKFSLKDLAVISVDSHSLPLRYGAVGISIGAYGLEPLRSYIGTMDIFGYEMKVTRSNIYDSLAAIATLSMGEGKERRPFVIARGVEELSFVNKQNFQDIVIPAQEDMYYPLLKLFKK